MAPSLVLAFFLLLPADVYSQVSLVESGGGIKKPGETLKLSCTVSGFSLTTYSVDWIRQSAGKGLEWVGAMGFDGSISYDDGLKSRLSITRDTFKSQVYLQLTGLQPGDTSVYFCARPHGYGGAPFPYWGQGTLVTVTTATPAAPNLFPLLPCGSDTNQDPASMGCLAKDFLPDSITFSWKDPKNTSITTGIQNYPSVLNTVGTYAATTQLSVSASKVPGTFYCSAVHPNGNRIAAVKFDPCTPKEPIMTVHPPARDDFLSPNKTSIITCFVTNLCSNTATFQWLRDGVPVTSGVNTLGPVSNGANGNSFTSKLTVTERDWDADRKFTCKMVSKNISEMRNTSKSYECGLLTECSPDIDAVVIPPTFADIYISKSATLTCRVINMQSTEGLSVSWTRKDGKVLTTSLAERKVQSNGRFSVDATASVCADEWERGDSYTCKVSHPDLIFPIQKTLTKQPVANSHAPSVYVLPPPSEQLALREAATITCLVKSFNPPDLFVKWLSNGEEVNASKYITAIPTRESSQSELYFTYSTLNINEQEWNAGNTYTCLVGHEKLPLQVTQKTVDKFTGKPTLVNVSLVMSETANTCY